MIDRNSAKAWLKVEIADEDTLIDGLVAAAVAHIEQVTGKNLSVKAFTQSLAGFPARSPYDVRLQRGPVVTIDGLSYDPADGTASVTLNDFRLVEGLNGSLLPAYGTSWPSTLIGPGTVRISGTAGFSAGEAPQLDQAAHMLVAHWYLNREAVNSGTSAGAVELPLGVSALIGPYCAVGIA